MRLKFDSLKVFYNEKYLILYTIQAPGIIFKKVSECISRKYFSARKSIINSKQ